MNRRSLLLAPLALGLCAWSEQTIPPNLLFKGVHPESLDPGWALLGSAQVAVDAKAGLMTAKFPADVTRLEGQPFKIEGFMLPLTPGRQTLHFAITRRNSTCPFCPPNQPNEAVEVSLTRLIPVTDQLMTVSGQLHLQASSDQGMFYQLRGASVV